MDWWLGPVGAMVSIPAPADPTEVSPELLGGVHTSLTGRVTVDRIALPRTWAMEWVALTESQLTYLDAVGHGDVPGPLRLIDPMWCNRLHRQIASGGSTLRTTTGFAQAGGEDPTWVPVTPPAGVPVRGGISWERATTGAGTLTTTGDNHRVPVIDGDQLQVSVWARGAAIQAAVAVDWWDTAGDDTRTTASAVTLHATTWTQLVLPWTVPAGAVSATPALVVASGQAASTLQATGWAITTSTTWTPGGGAPTVVATELEHAYSLYDQGRHRWAMTLREAA